MKGVTREETKERAQQQGCEKNKQGPVCVLVHVEKALFAFRDDEGS